MTVKSVSEERAQLPSLTISINRDLGDVEVAEGKARLGSEFKVNLAVRYEFSTFEAPISIVMDIAQWAIDGIVPSIVATALWEMMRSKSRRKASYVHINVRDGEHVKKFWAPSDDIDVLRESLDSFRQVATGPIGDRQDHRTGYSFDQISKSWKPFSRDRGIMSEISAKDVARFMRDWIDREGYIYQPAVVKEISSQFGDKFVRGTPRGGAALVDSVLREFRKINKGNGDDVEYIRPDHVWRKK